jgi:hypothetical protein
MSKYYTGIDGSLLINGTEIAKIRNWSLSGSADTLATTNLGQSAPTYRFGRQSYNGSATALYYTNSVGALEMAPLLANTIRTSAVSTSSTHTLKLKIDTAREIEATVLINSAELSCSAGDVMTVNISFVVSGLLSIATMGAA